MRPLTLIIVLLLASCGSSGPYHPANTFGGYAHTRVSDTEYRVTYRGNAFVSAEAIRDFATLRAAEIGYELGFTHMVVTGEEDASTSKIFTTQVMTGRDQNGSAQYSPNIQTATKHGLAISVLYSDGPPEGRYLEVHQLGELIPELKQKHGIQ